MKITAKVLLTALGFSTLCSAVAEVPIEGLHISCVPDIEPAECVSRAVAAAAAADAAAVAATPTNRLLAPRAVNCGKVTGVLSAVKALGPAATAFCSAYLHIPGVSTVATTITPPAVTRTVTVTVVSTVLIITPIGFKRTVPTTAGSGGSKGILSYAAGEISSACSCLNIKPKSTTTITITAPPPTVDMTITTNIITTIRTCTADDGPCQCFNPGACCHGGCSCNDNNGNPINTCFS